MVLTLCKQASSCWNMTNCNATTNKDIVNNCVLSTLWATRKGINHLDLDLVTVSPSQWWNLEKLNDGAFNSYSNSILLATSQARTRWVWGMLPSSKISDERYFCVSRLSKLCSHWSRQNCITIHEYQLPLGSRLAKSPKTQHAWRKWHPSVSSLPNEKSKVYKPVFAQETLVVLRLCSGRCWTNSPFLPICSSVEFISSFFFF